MTDSMRDRLREEIARVLRGAGLTDKPAQFDGNIHSWRCEYPDRYGACDCFDELVSDLEKALMTPCSCSAQREHERAERAEAKLDAVREYHERVEFDGSPGEFYCRRCQVTAGLWPCETIKILDGEADDH